MPGSKNSITICRITHQRYQDEPFSGEGGLQYRSRWASRGQLVSYGADHLATATLEKIAGVKRPDLLTQMVYVKAAIDAAYVDVLSEDEWPKDWNALPATDATRVVGDGWLEAGEKVVLRVPAVVLPEAYNYVINAGHPDVDKLKVQEVLPLLLDNRVLHHLGAVEG